MGRLWHAVTAMVSLVAVVWQVALVINGEAVLDVAEPPSTAVALGRFVSYFTIQSNVIVLVTVGILALRPAPDSRLFRVARLDGLVGITVTGVVHFLYLRPLLHLSGGPYATDKLLHVAVPLLAVIGWVAFGPRGQVSRDLLLPTLAWPGAYVVLTLVRGAATDWYPYPFIDVTEKGYPAALFAGLGVAVLFLAVAIAFWEADERATS